MTAEIAILNATIRPDPGAPEVVQALAMGAGKVLAVGANEEIWSLCCERTQVIDAGGATVLPGFVESHMHLFLGAFSLKVLNLVDATGLEDLRMAVLEFADANRDAPLLVAQGFAYGALDCGKDPDRHVLDAICPDRPLLLQSSDFHNGWCNTVALKQAGIFHGRDVGPGSEVVVDDQGEATGLLVEPAAVAYVLALGEHGGREGLGLEGVEPATEVSLDQRATDKALLREGLNHCAAQGITTIINMDGNLYQAGLLREIEVEGGLSCRVELPYHFIPGEPLENVEHAEAMRRDLATEMLWCGRIKMFIDGVLDGYTAWRLEEYPTRPGVTGTPLHDPERLKELALEFDRRGFQISIHAIGNGAVRGVLDAYEAAREANGARDSRHRIEHIEMIAQSDIARIPALGVVASLNPPHVPGHSDFPMQPTMDLIGKQHWTLSYPWKTLADAGAPVCFSSDWPVAVLSPLKGMEMALTRTPWSADEPDERLGFGATVAAYTSGGAYAARKDHLFGRLLPGMAADVVVLDRLLKEGSVGDAQVVMTLCNGQVSYSKAEG